jgi:hypothetical protein
VKTLSTIPQLTTPNALYYDTVGKKVSWNTAGGGGGSLNEYVIASKTTTTSIPLNMDTLLDFDSIHTSVGWASSSTVFTWQGGSTRVFEVSFIGYCKCLATGSNEIMYNVITRNGTNIANSGGICMCSGDVFSGTAVTDNVLVSTCWVALNNNDTISARAVSSGSTALDFNSPSFTATGGRVFNPASYTMVIKELA